MPMQHIQIELHDSTVISVEVNDERACLDMEVVIHSNKGKSPNSHSIFTQSAIFKIGHCRILNNLHEFPLWILDGTITIDNESFDNMVPISFHRTGAVVLSFSGAEGTLRIVGDSVNLELQDEPQYLEEFQDDNA